MRTGNKTTKKKRTQKTHKNKDKSPQTKNKDYVFLKKITSATQNLLHTIGHPITKLVISLLKLFYQLVIKISEFVTQFNNPESSPYYYKVTKKTKQLRKSIFPKRVKKSGTQSTSVFHQILKTKWRKKQLKKAIESLAKKTDKQIIIYRRIVSNLFFLKRNSKTEKKLLRFHQHFSKAYKKTSRKTKIATNKTLLHLTNFLAEVRKSLFNTWIQLRLFQINSSQGLKKGFSQSTKSLRQNLILKKIHGVATYPINFKLRYLFVSLVLVSFGAGSYYFYQEIITELPDPTSLQSYQPSLTTKIYDRNGILLYKIFKNENRSLVPLSEIPAHMIQATIAIEDKSFYEHPGFSVRGITRALQSNLKNESLQGGSTITQQLIKNTLLTPERTYERKIKELILSFVTEFYYSKDEILSMYLNQVAYGGSSYGVEEAAQMYFGKSIRNVDIAEAAFLAGLTVAPTRYSPYGAHPEIAKSRQVQVLRRMVEDGYISVEQAEEARTKELAILPPKLDLLAPHFVMYVRDYLSELYGVQMIEQGGLEVTTSLDLALQNHAQKIVVDEVSRLKNLNVTNGAALITEPATGEILAMVGSTNYFDSTNDGQVNITIRERQPGSSIKPLTYAMALERGLSPVSTIPDTPICYKIEGQREDYCPKNYDGRFHGKVTLRQALANSYNIPAVKLLAQFSVNDLIDKAEAMGISTWTERNRFGLALTLGGGEVKMTDMAVAYGVFANGGMKVPLNPVLEVKDAQGNILHTNPCLTEDGQVSECQPERALDPRVAYQISDILSDNDARSQAFGRNSVLHIPGQQVAVKTGTTNDLRDNWTFGFTQDRVVATWVGNNDNSQMSYVASGITGASPIWNSLMKTQLLAESPHQFNPPTNLVKVSICSITGQLPCNGCPTKEEYFIPGTEPVQACSSESIARRLNPEEQP